MSDLPRLHQFPAAFGLPSASPFCCKVGTYLRFVGQPYEVVAADPRSTPKGKLPVLEIDGRRIADSEAIIAYWVASGRRDPDSGLTAEQRALATAVRRMVEEHLYWGMTYSRLIDEPSWSVGKEVFLASVPALLRGLVGGMLQRKVRSDLRGHGMGRHSREEIYERAGHDVDHLATLLGDKQYFFGDEPTSLDATLYGFLACILIPETKTPLTLRAETHSNLVAYVRRIGERYYGSAS